MIGVAVLLPGIAGWWLGRQGYARETVELEQVPLSGGFDQPFPPWAKDEAAVEIELLTQFLDRLLVILDDLLVDFRGFIERRL